MLLTLLASFYFVQSTEIECSFPFPYNVYTCELLNVTIDDNASQEFVIVRNHFNRTDEHVRSIHIRTSNIPFIISELFSTFPNVFRFWMDFSGLTRIQPNAFDNAKNLEFVVILGNPLHTIHADAFFGASKLTNLGLRMNRIETIHENAFRGQANLLNLMLEENRIRRLQPKVFEALTNVESILMSDNQIEVVEGKLFLNNQRLRNIDFARNRINEVQSSILSGLEDLQFINFFGNRCVDNFWAIDEEEIGDIRKGLAECFKNYKAVGRLRVEVRGSLTISDDYGNKVFDM